MVALEISHTAYLDEGKRAAVRALLDLSFGGEFSESDWAHSLGGMHVLIWDDAELLGHGAVVQRRVICAGRSLRAGYVEAMAIRPGRRRHGFGRMLMREIEEIVRNSYDIGLLSATDDGAALYRALGWQPWTGPTSVLTPEGVQPTEDDDGSIYVLPLDSGVDIFAEITCDWRDGDVW